MEHERDIVRRVDIVDHALVDQQADHVRESPLDSSDKDGLASLDKENKREGRQGERGEWGWVGGWVGRREGGREERLK